jgi:hypothetical protein
MSELKTRLQNAANEISAALQLPEETGDVAALRAEVVKLRGLLRGTYHAAELLNNKQIDPMWTRQLTDTEAQDVNRTIQAIRHATGEYSGESQVIIGEDVNIPIGDIFGEVLGMG